MRIKLSDHFTYRKLLRFTFPSIIMMVFTSVYSLVDGYFVSNYVGKTAFAAINMTGPIFMIIGSIGMMIGAGGTAIIGKTLGEKKNEEANAYFSMLVYTILLTGIAVGLIGWFSVRPISLMLGAEGEMLKNCTLYGCILFTASPFFLLQFSIQSFFITAEKPTLGMLVTILGGVSNIILDALFVAIFQWGLLGAALATAFSQSAATIISLIYFAGKNDSLLHLTKKTKFYGRILLKACTNGSSEMVTNMAVSIVTILYNYQLLRFYGENGVAAYGVLMYVEFIFSAIYYGYAMGSAPIISYHFGAENSEQLKNIFHKSLVLVGIAGICMFTAAKLSAPLLTNIFVGYDKGLFDLTIYALQIYSFAFLFIGFNAFGSCFFTALNDGLVSAVISFLRTFIFEIGSVLLLPLVFGKSSIWYAFVAAELSAMIITGIFFVGKRKKYNYM